MATLIAPANLPFEVGDRVKCIRGVWGRIGIGEEPLNLAGHVGVVASVGNSGMYAHYVGWLPDDATKRPGNDGWLIPPGDLMLLESKYEVSWA